MIAHTAIKWDLQEKYHMFLAGKKMNDFLLFVPSVQMRRKFAKTRHKIPLNVFLNICIDHINP